MVGPNETIKILKKYCCNVSLILVLQGLFHCLCYLLLSSENLDLSKKPVILLALQEANEEMINE